MLSTVQVSASTALFREFCTCGSDPVAYYFATGSHAATLPNSNTLLQAAANTLQQLCISYHSFCLEVQLIVAL